MNDKSNNPLPLSEFSRATFHDVILFQSRMEASTLSSERPAQLEKISRKRIPLNLKVEFDARSFEKSSKLTTTSSGGEERLVERRGECVGELTTCTGRGAMLRGVDWDSVA